MKDVVAKLQGNATEEAETVDPSPEQPEATPETNTTSDAEETAT